MRLADLFVGIKADTKGLKKELTQLPKSMGAAVIGPFLDDRVRHRP